MKRILVLTDFSAPSKNAAHFAKYLANTLKADLTLCHAIKPVVAFSTPVLPDQYIEVRDLAIEELEFQAAELRTEEDELCIGKSLVNYCTFIGPIIDMVDKLSKDKEIDLVVMGMFGAGMINRMILGSNSQDLVNRATYPVLLVPFKNFSGVIHKIAFASDLDDTDIGIIQSLVSFARPFNAEILIIHIGSKKADQHEIDYFLSQVTDKVNYPNIYYRHVENKDTIDGLNWIAKNGLIDVFAMVHRKKTFLENLFTGSCTQKLSRNIDIPLLVFQENNFQVF
ncbi:nucleotide-binding universal stress UspA family protein [Pedobacter sp. UYP24]